MANNAFIEQALDDLKSQKRPNVTAIAKKYNIIPSTLLRRFKNKTISAKKTRSKITQHLTNTQKKTFLKYINKFIDRKFYSISRIFKNLVIEILGYLIGDNWVKRFCKRYKKIIKNIYLRGIDQTRNIINNLKYF